MRGDGIVINLKKILSDKRLRVIALLLAALSLLLLVWLVFFSNREERSYQSTAEEQKLATLLESLDGVDKVTVMVSGEEGEPTSAVVVFRGEDSLLLRNRILNASAAALNLSPKNVQVYPAKK